MSPKPKVAMSIYSYGADIRRRRMTVEDAIDHAVSVGAEGVELVDKQHIPNYPYPSVYDLRKLRDYVESLGAKMVCYSTYVDRAILSDREATIGEMVKMMHEQIAVADVLGAEIYRPAILPSARVQSENAFIKERIELVKEVLPDLRKYDIKLGVEIHAPMQPELLLRLAKKVNDKSFGLIPDFSVWATKQALDTHIIGKASLESFKAVMPYTIHVHAKAHMFNEKGEELTHPYKELITILKESGYDGYISAEFEGWWEGEDYDSKRIAETHINLIKRYL